MINAGKLNRRILIQQPSGVKDDSGHRSDEWADVVSTWASITAPTSKEVYALGAGFTAQVTHKITIRWRPGIGAGMRIVFRERIFQVQTASDPDEGRVELNLMCLEVDGGGQNC